MKRFEYTSKEVRFEQVDSEKQLIDVLNEYGSKGWEIVTMSISKLPGFIAGTPYYDIGGTIYFKRQRT